MAIYSEEEDPNVEMWNKQNSPNYDFVNDFGNNVSCRPFTNVDPDVSGVEVSISGNRLGSMVGVTLPDEDDEDEVIKFENEVTDWIIENE